MAVSWLLCIRPDCTSLLLLLPLIHVLAWQTEIIFLLATAVERQVQVTYNSLALDAAIQRTI